MQPGSHFLMCPSYTAVADTDGHAILVHYVFFVIAATAAASCGVEDSAAALGKSAGLELDSGFM